MEILLYVLGVIGFTHIMVDSKIMQPLRDWLAEPTWPSFATILKTVFIYPFLFAWQLVRHPIQCFEKYVVNFLRQIMACYQCCGFWCGLITGWLAFPTITVGQILCSGFAGSFLAYLGSDLLNYLEAQTIINLPEEPKNG